MNARLKRLLSASKVMRVVEAADVLDLSYSAVTRATRAKGVRLGSEQVNLRSHDGSKRGRPTITLSRGAVLRYIVRTSFGDEREELLREIELHAPGFLEMAKRAAEKADEQEEGKGGTGEEESQESQASRPKNVITFKRGHRARPDPAPGHPDLFEEVSA